MERQRKPNVTQNAAARELARAFETVTGRKPTISTRGGEGRRRVARGPYLALVKDVFEIAGLPDRAAETAARQALYPSPTRKKAR